MSSSVGMMTSQYMESHKIHVPNHQSVYIYHISHEISLLWLAINPNRWFKSQSSHDCFYPQDLSIISHFCCWLIHVNSAQNPKCRFKKYWLVKNGIPISWIVIIPEKSSTNHHVSYPQSYPRSIINQHEFVEPMFHVFPPFLFGFPTMWGPQDSWAGL